MESLASISKHEIDVNDESNTDCLSIDLGLRNCARETEDSEYGSLKKDDGVPADHDRDLRITIDVFETDEGAPRTDGAMKNKNNSLGLGITQKLGTSHMLAAYVAFFCLGSLLINTWPHPRLELAEHEDFVAGRDQCVKSFKACTTEEKISNSTCTEKFVECGRRLESLSDQCTADYVNCSNWANSLNGEHRKEGLDRCQMQLGQCQAYSNRKSDWKGVAFVVMLLTVLGLLSQSVGVFVFLWLVEVAVGLYTDSFRGYALGSFLAGVVFPCIGGNALIEQAQRQARV